MRVKETTVYTFAELSDAAKDKARAWFRELEAQDLDFSFILEDVATIADMLGIALKTRIVRLHGGGTRSEPCIFYSLGGGQGDGACFEGRYAHKAGSVAAVRKHAPKDKELLRIAQGLTEVQAKHRYKVTADITHMSAHYSHENTVHIDVEVQEGAHDLSLSEADRLCELLRGFMRWIYRRVKEDYEYRLSDEAIDEAITINDYEFTENGKVA